MKTFRLIPVCAAACLMLATRSPAFTTASPVMERNPLNGMPTMTWHATSGQTYFIQVSTDLITWTYLPEVIAGGDDDISVPFDPVASPKLFARLRYTDALVAGLPGDADFDGDGLTNMAELLLGTDPLNPDTNGDGLPDGTDLIPPVTDLVDLPTASTMVVWNPCE